MWKQENQDRHLKQQLYHFWEESKNKRMHTLYEASFLFYRPGFTSHSDLGLPTSVNVILKEIPDRHIRRATWFGQIFPEVLVLGDSRVSQADNWNSPITQCLGTSTVYPRELP